MLGVAARHPLRRRHGPAVRHLRRAAAAAAATSSATGSPSNADDSDFVYRQAIRAKAFDALRGMLPAASLSNVGIYGTGQGYEQLLLRMRAHPLPEARALRRPDAARAAQGHPVVPQAGRPDRPRRGRGATTSPTTRDAMDELAERLVPGGDAASSRRRRCTLVDFDPDAEVKLLAAMLYPYTNLPEHQIERRVRAMSADERVAVVRAYVGDREQPPPQAGPRARADRLPVRRAGRLRRVPRPAAPPHADDRVAAADARATATPGPRRSTRPAAPTRSTSAMDRSARALRRACTSEFPDQAPYAVSLAYKVRFVMQFNAREAMHLLELRTTPQGHPAYRLVAQEMHRLIAEQAGHPAVAEMMRFVDHSPEPELERLDAERRAEARRQGA